MHAPAAVWTTELPQSHSDPLWCQSIWRRRGSQSWGWKASARADSRRTELARPSLRSPPPPPSSRHPRWPLLQGRWGRADQGPGTASGFVWFHYQVLWIQPDRRTCHQESSSSFPVSTGFHQGGPPAWSQPGLERHKAEKELHSHRWNYFGVSRISVKSNLQLEDLDLSSTELLSIWQQGPEISYRLVDSRCCERPWGSCSPSSGSSACIRPPPGWCCCHTSDRSCSGRATPTPIEPEPRFLEDSHTQSNQKCLDLNCQTKGINSIHYQLLLRWISAGLCWVTLGSNSSFLCSVSEVQQHLLLTRWQTTQEAPRSPPASERKALSSFPLPGRWAWSWVSEQGLWLRHSWTDTVWWEPGRETFTISSTWWCF